MPNITEYSGNAGLGGGAIRPQKTDFDVINKTAENIMLMDAQRNLKLYDQKVKDRDTQLKLLEEGQISAGNVTDKDRAVINDLQKKADGEWDKLVKAGGLNNQEAYLNYKKSIKGLSDAATWAQHKYINRTQLEQEKAKSTSPKVQKSYEDLIKKGDDGGFFDDYGVYQQVLKNDQSWIENQSKGRMGGQEGTPIRESVTTTQQLGKAPKTTTKVTTAPQGQKAGKNAPMVTSGDAKQIQSKDGLHYTSSEQRYDAKGMVDDVTKKYLEGEEDTQQMNSFRKAIETNELGNADEVVNHIVDRYNDYVKQTGDNLLPQPIVAEADKNGNIKQGQPKNANIYKTDDGRFMIKIPTSQFSALTVLANHKGDYVSKSTQWNKDLDTYMDKVRHEKVMEAIGWDKAKSYKDNIRSQMSLRKTKADKEKFLDDYYLKGVTSAPSVTETPSGNYKLEHEIDASKSQPFFTIKDNKPYAIIPIGAKPVYAESDYAKNSSGSVVVDPKTKQPVIVKGAKPIYYEGGHYDKTYKAGNVTLDANKVQQGYLAFKKSNKGWDGTIDEYTNLMIDNGYYDVEVKGQGDEFTNGRTNKAAHILMSPKKNAFSSDDAETDSQPPKDETTIQETNYENYQTRY